MVLKTLVTLLGSCTRRARARLKRKFNGMKNATSFRVTKIDLTKIGSVDMLRKFVRPV